MIPLPINVVLQDKIMVGGWNTSQLSRTVRYTTTDNVKLPLKMKKFHPKKKFLSQMLSTVKACINSNFYGLVKYSLSDNSLVMRTSELS